MGAGSCPLPTYPGFLHAPCAPKPGLLAFTLAANIGVPRHLGSTPRPLASSQVPLALSAQCLQPYPLSFLAGLPGLKTMLGGGGEEVPAGTPEVGGHLESAGQHWGRDVVSRFSEFSEYSSLVLAPLHRPLQTPRHTPALPHGCTQSTNAAT